MSKLKELELLLAHGKISRREFLARRICHGYCGRSAYGLVDYVGTCCDIQKGGAA